MVAVALMAVKAAATVVVTMRVVGLGNWGFEEMVPTLLFLVCLVCNSTDVFGLERLKTLVFGLSLIRVGGLLFKLCLCFV